MTERDHLPPVDPPIIDMLVREDAPRSFSIYFVPQDAVSRAEKEFVRIDHASVEGRAIEACLGELAQVLGLGAPLGRVVHGGGGTFTFFSTFGASVSLDNPGLSSRDAQRVYDLLQYISLSAEHSFVLARGGQGKPERATA